MNFSDWLGERRRHSRSYGNDEQQRQAGKGTISCQCFGETNHQPACYLEKGGRKRQAEDAPAATANPAVQTTSDTPATAPAVPNSMGISTLDPLMAIMRKPSLRHGARAV